MRISGTRTSFFASGHKGNVIKDYFLHYEESVSNDFVLSQGGKKIDFVNRDIDDWTITFVETGVNANIGERFKAVEPYLKGEEMFLANYADGLSDLDLPVMIDEFRRSNAVGSLLLVQPTASFDIVRLSPEGKVGQISPLSKTDIWINGGFFVFRQGDLPVHEAGRRTRARTVPAADREGCLVGASIRMLLAVHGYFQGQAMP